MKNRREKKRMKRFIDQLKVGQLWLQLECAVFGHKYRDLLDIGEICIRCGDELKRIKS